MSPVRATVLQLSLDLQLRTLQLSRYARSKRILQLSVSQCQLRQRALHAACTAVCEKFGLTGRVLLLQCRTGDKGGTTTTR